MIISIRSAVPRVMLPVVRARVGVQVAVTMRGTVTAEA